MNINSKIGLKLESFFKTIFISFNHRNINNIYYNNDFSKINPKGIFTDFSYFLFYFILFYLIKKNNHLNEFDIITQDITIPLYYNTNDQNIIKLNYYFTK